MADVFISYSSKDEEKAKEALHMLEASGITCWFAARDIPPGTNYAVEIPKAISACRFFVLMLSGESQDSPYVKLELDQAVKRKKEILPVLLEELQQTDDTNFFLNAKQSVNAVHDFANAVNEVINRIKQTSGLAPVTFKDVKPEYICCPRCGCSVLRFRNGEYHYLDTQKKAEEYALSFLGIAFSIPVALVFLSMLYSFMLPPDTIIGCMMEYSMMLCGLSFLLSMVAAFVKARHFLQEWRDIERSNLHVWAFICIGCKKKFRYYAPLNEKPENRVKELFYERKK